MNTTMVNKMKRVKDMNMRVMKCSTMLTIRMRKRKENS